MARPPKYTPEDVDAFLSAYRRAGSIDGALEAIRRAGQTPPSHGWAHKVLANRRKPAIEVDAPTAIPSPPADPDEIDIMAELRRSVVDLRKAASQALADDNRKDFSTLTRSLTAVLAQLERLTPPPPVDSSETPDMVQAARLGRERLWTLIRRARERL